MNKEEFYAIDPDERVEHINKMLQNQSINDVAKEIGISPSTFCKEMTTGDYVYIKRENQYYKFVRDMNSIKLTVTSDTTIAFIEKNINTLRKIVSLYQEQVPLILDEKVYNKNAEFINKNFRLNSAIYEELNRFWESDYPSYRLQDLIGQAFLEFIQKYRKK
jgi:hypothetical protein